MINYVTGDATLPQGDGVKIIVHCVNNIGKWGSGFVLALNQRFGDEPRLMYQQWYRNGNAVLGNVLFVKVHPEPNLWIANVVGQHQTIRENPSPIRYMALRRGLITTGEFCKQLAVDTGAQVSMHAPKLGSGLAKGDWNKIADMLHEIFESEYFCRIPFTIYELGV